VQDVAHGPPQSSKCVALLASAFQTEKQLSRNEFIKTVALWPNTCDAD